MKLPDGVRTLFEVALVALVVALVLRPPPAGLFYRESVVHRVVTREKVVALTFDDGPHPDFTPRILRILDRHRVKATFFMIGQRMEQYPEVVKAVVAAGHAVGNHTYSHPAHLETARPEQILRELEQCERLIERLTGRRARLFRPPRGLLNGEIWRIAEAEGYRTILWTVSADHHDAPTPEEMTARVTRQVIPGAIVLTHDGSVPSRWKDVAATSQIIEALAKRGYRFVTVPELLELEGRERRPLP